MIFVKVSPSTDNLDKVNIEVKKDKILLWSSNGYYYTWQYELPKGLRLQTGVDTIQIHKNKTTKLKHNLSIRGNSERTNHIKEQIELLLPTDILYTFYLLETQRWYYPYVATCHPGKLIIKDNAGNTYGDISELI